MASNAENVSIWWRHHDTANTHMLTHHLCSMFMVCQIHWSEFSDKLFPCNSSGQLHGLTCHFKRLLVIDDFTSPSDTYANNRYHYCNDCRLLMMDTSDKYGGCLCYQKMALSNKICTYIHIKLWDLIIHLWHTFIAGLDERQWQFGHGWVITYCIDLRN